MQTGMNMHKILRHPGRRQACGRRRRLKPGHSRCLSGRTMHGRLTALQDLRRTRVPGDLHRRLSDIAMHGRLITLLNLCRTRVPRDLRRRLLGSRAHGHNRPPTDRIPRVRRRMLRDPHKTRALRDLFKVRAVHGRRHLRIRVEQAVTEAAEAAS